MEKREEVAQSSIWSWMVLAGWFFFATRFMYTSLMELNLPRDVVIITMVGVLVIAATVGFHNNFANLSLFGYVGITIWLYISYGIAENRYMMVTGYQLAFLTFFFSTYTLLALFLKNEIYVWHRESKNG